MNKNISGRVINANSLSWREYFDSIYNRSGLIISFAKRDLKIKYAQTFLGLSWVLLQPLAAVVIYTIFFNYFIKFNVTYPFVLYVLSGVLFWNLFNYIFSHGSTCLINNQEIIKKLHFPKLILSISKVFVGLSEFAVTLFLFLILIIFFQVPFRATFVWFFLAMLPIILFSLGLALILSSVSLKNRDLFHFIPFLVNFGIWFTPVFFPVSIIPEEFQFMLYFNPITSGIQFFRYCFFGDSLNIFMWIGLFVSIIFFIIGLILFKRTEDEIIDLL